VRIFFLPVQDGFSVFYIRRGCLSCFWGADGSGKSTVIQKTALNNKSGSFNILFVGNLFCWKGAHLALRAFSKFLQKYSNAHFTLIGKGPDEDWIKTLIPKLNLGDKLTWLRFLPRQELLNQYADYDVFLFPSLHDSGGMVVLEAMTNGLPAICLDIGGPGQTVIPDCGAVIATQNIDEEALIHQLTEALERIFLLTPEQRQALSDNAIQRASRFTWSAIVDACL
jgi:glycosyltransferase involved in cell wall biosynthesis